ncbi:type II and III secretion system protein family protein [Hoeflea sp.]|uniref:type II and III secretion system protein family protein n=1 Tax=Hoeflea sp. TaxID=1940281 RepID=UPI0019A2CCE6|nr:type II and III secretion system protein family protein [Hoeflea sp.]MBC7281732.1 type II and III secretion system protein family protein [Hoeflea sp.]
MNVRHIAKSLLSSIAGIALVGTAVFAGIAVDPFSGRLVSAAAASESVIKIRQAGPGVTKRIKLGLNKAIVIDLPTDAHDILVADPSLADAVTRTSRRLYLFGKTVGQTNIFIFGPGGEEIVAINLEIERDVSGLQSHLARFLPDSDINVEIISDNIVLTGSVRTPQDAAQAARLAEIFLTGGEATTRNITADGTDGGSAAIFAEGRQQSQIVNLLKIDGEDQVTLKITVAEVSREVLKQLGFNNSVSNSSGLDVLTMNNAAETAGAGISGTITGSLGKYGIESVLNAMEQAKVIRTLAEPSLTAISGESAAFRSGGEILRNVYQPDGSIATESYQYGIKLNFTPVVLSAGRISLKISTEVSEPLTEGNTTEFRTRQIETSVELPSGGSIALAGLVRDTLQQSMQGVPGASKIPVFGTMFRSRAYSRVETELVVIATPYLVKPVARNALARPDDNFNAPSDGAGFFLGRVNRVFGRMETELPPGRYHGVVGFIYK